MRGWVDPTTGLAEAAVGFYDRGIGGRGWGFDEVHIRKAYEG